MILIGITGGVGSGKSEVLRYLKNKYNARVLLADDVANSLKEPGMPCYEPVIRCLGPGILNRDKTIDKVKMAQAIFSGDGKLAEINAIIHPAVRTYIEQEIKREKKEDKYEFFFLEAALLIEEHYDEIVDELWYIYADEAVRRERLKVSRGYPEEKITSIMEKQLSEQQFREACSFVLDNSGSFEDTQKKIDEKMGVYLCRKQI
ncbi:MAG: dephospho-CoA kinase [Lachnospiraceae bacterium]|nr:dephospho-CoA kinase [Lachnospiraceae bacterium]